MATACIAHSTLRVHGISKPVIARFDQPHASSDGGAILLKAADDRLGLTWRLASVLRDRRQPGKVTHSVRDLLRQRVFGLACGYADCNDAARLVDDPIHKLLLERDPLDGAALGSQPTLSRFENAVGRADLYRLGTAVADAVLMYHRARLGDGAGLITIDLDATDDPTHGQQELALFNGYYDTWCYLPLIATVTFNTEPMQHVVAAVLRPGTGAATRGVRGLLRRLFGKLRTLFPRARLRVRADAGFAEGKLLAFLDAAGVEYVLGLTGNQRLDKRVRRLLGRARVRARTSGETATLYGETRYAARRWNRKRRIIMKAEVLCYPGRARKDNPRFLVTNLPHRPATVYTRLYCGRGDMENRLKELQQGVAMDRTSCSRFPANQFRLLLSVAAYVLFQVLQGVARGTVVGAAQVSTLRASLLKVAVWIERSVRRVVLHFPQAYPWRDAWQQLAQALHAT
ncbi:MAG: IS1380 family transposase [Gammaproteobacteria bacterium]|nr:IS1380 family transposase [Gammaproteobacteria bacterium]